MNVYLLLECNYPTIYRGCYQTLDQAKKVVGGIWYPTYADKANHRIINWSSVQMSKRYQIISIPFVTDEKNPLIDFAVKVLESDPMACDAVRDILKC